MMIEDRDLDKFFASNLSTIGSRKYAIMIAAIKGDNIELIDPKKKAIANIDKMLNIILSRRIIIYKLLI